MLAGPAYDDHAARFLGGADRHARDVGGGVDGEPEGAHPRPPPSQMRSAECGVRNVSRPVPDPELAPRIEPGIAIPHSALRTHGPLACPSPYLLQLPNVWCVPVAQSKVPVQRRRPGARALGPL